MGDAPYPGDKVKVEVGAKPGSLCAIGVVDRTVHAMHESNTITIDKVDTPCCHCDVTYWTAWSRIFTLHMPSLYLCYISFNTYVCTYERTYVHTCIHTYTHSCIIYLYIYPMVRSTGKSPVRSLSVRRRRTNVTLLSWMRRKPSR